jgi:hypothetical protein
MDNEMFGRGPDRKTGLPINRADYLAAFTANFRCFIDRAQDREVLLRVIFAYPARELTVLSLTGDRKRQLFPYHDLDKDIEKIFAQYKLGPTVTTTAIAKDPGGTDLEVTTDNHLLFALGIGIKRKRLCFPGDSLRPIGELWIAQRLEGENNPVLDVEDKFSKPLVLV